MPADECPSIRRTALTFAPDWTARLAAVYRRSYGESDELGLRWFLTLDHPCGRLVRDESKWRVVSASLRYSAWNLTGSAASIRVRPDMRRRSPWPGNSWRSGLTDTHSTGRRATLHSGPPSDRTRKLRGMRRPVAPYAR
jgi:hypothetical protein